VPADSSRGTFRRFLRSQGNVLLIWGILIVLVIFSSLASDRFLTPFNLGRLITQLAPLAILAIGQTFVLLTAGIDLSVGSLVSLTSLILVAIITENPLTWGLGVGAALLVGLGVGFANGLIVTRLRISPFMATLTTLSIVQGVALLMPQGTLPRDFGEIITGEIVISESFVIPIPLIIVIIAASVSLFILGQTPFGRHLYAVGSNETATRLSGMATDRLKLSAYVICSLLSAFAGIYVAARGLSGNPINGEGLEFDAITAAVLGGISLFGGRGSVLGTIAGVIIIAVMGNMLNLLRVPSDYQYILRGSLLVLAVMVYSRRMR
jgi:ribose transport system permease protein